MTRRPALSAPARPAPTDPAASHRRRDEARPAHQWYDEDAGVCITMKIEMGVAVLTVVGPVRAEAIPLCGRALQSVLHTRVPALVIDLTSADVDEQAVPGLGALCRLAGRHGLRTWIGAAHQGTGVLLASLDGPGIHVAPTPAVALREAHAFRSGRT